MYVEINIPDMRLILLDQVTYGIWPHIQSSIKFEALTLQLYTNLPLSSRSLVIILSPLSDQNGYWS